MNDTVNDPIIPLALTTPVEPGLDADMRKALIEQLSKEVQASADSIMSLRTRTAFTIWVGPYVVLGSVVVATKGGFTLNIANSTFQLGIVAAVGCYLALGYAAGRIEKYALERSNQYRTCIIDLATTGKMNSALYLDTLLPSMIVRSYHFVFLALLVCFFGVALLVSAIQPKAEPVPATPPSRVVPIVALPGRK